MAVTEQLNKAAAAADQPSDLTQIACKFVTKLPANFRVPEDPVVGI